MLHLTDGFESAYDMELLATVHWVATRDDERAIEDAEIAGRLVRDWSPRKSGLFGQAHVEIAWRQLRDEGWFEATSPAPLGALPV